MKKKVLYLITKSNWGGAQRYVYDLATNLDREQFEPVVALGGSGQLAELLGHAGVRVIRIDALERDVKLTKEFAVARELWRIFRSERPVVLHLNSSKAGAVGALIGRLARVPRIIFTAHGWAFNEARPRWQRYLLKALHWLTVLLSHRTIAVSRAMVTQMDWPGARARMIVRNPGRTIGVTYTKAEARAHLGNYAPQLSHYSRDPWIGMVAELHPVKQHAVLLQSTRELIRQHPRVRVVLVGDGELADTLDAAIARDGLAEHVFRTGAVPEAARFLKAFDVLVLPSRSESYGYVLHEAGLLGVPVVASDVGGIRDIVTHEESGLLVQSADAAALRDALGTLLASKTLRSTYAAALRESMNTRTAAAMTRATEALYTLDRAR